MMIWALTLTTRREQEQICNNNDTYGGAVLPPAERKIKMEKELNLIKHLEDLISQKGISISKLARNVDLHQDTIYNYLNKKSSISADNYQRLIDKLEKKT